MPQFRYKAQNEKGKSVDGMQAAADESALQRDLREHGLLLLSAQEDGSEQNTTRALRDNQLAEFCRQIGTLVGSGVSLVRALYIISKQETLRNYERIIYENVLRSVRRGIPLSDSMEQLNGAFPDLLINMVRSAEAAGNLDKVAMRMASHYDKQYKLTKKVQSGLTYPKILSVLIVIVVAIIMGFVMPQFAELFSQMETLPLPTRILMGISDFFVGYWWAAAAAVAIAVVLWRVIRLQPNVRLAMDKLKVKIPVFGPLQRTVVTARFARSLASLYSSGIPIVTCLNIAGHTIGNTYIEKQFESVITQVQQGRNLSEALDGVDGFVKKLVFSIRVGEETGSMDSMLDSIADTLEFESEIAINRMVTYIEPAMIVFMAVIVGFVMISVLMPIYGSYQVIGAEA